VTFPLQVRHGKKCHTTRSISLSSLSILPLYHPSLSSLCILPLYPSSVSFLTILFCEGFINYFCGMRLTARFLKRILNETLFSPLCSSPHPYPSDQRTLYSSIPLSRFPHSLPPCLVSTSKDLFICSTRSYRRCSALHPPSGGSGP
jgi:hypothetical protein